MSPSLKINTFKCASDLDFSTHKKNEDIFCRLLSFSIENVTDQWSSCVIDLVNWANKAGDKEEGDKDSGADPDDAEVGKTDVLAHRLSGVVVAVVIRAETPTI